MSQSTLTGLFSAVCPWLALIRALQVLKGCYGLRQRGCIRLSLLGLAALGILVVPVQGISIAGWVRGLNANFCLPLTALLAVAVWEEEFGAKLFSARDWTAGWVVIAAAGVGLYPCALGWGSFDPYQWGWGFSPLFVGSAVLTGGLLWKQNRFGLVLLVAILAYHLGLLESNNYWDYLVDPIAWLVAALALARRLLGRAWAFAGHLHE
jgi:hypothetical protein